MKTARTKLISWMLMLVMAISLISPGASLEANAAKAYDGYVYVTVEKLTLGQGFAQIPVKVGYYEEDTLTDILERGLGDNLIASSGTYGTSIDGYKDGGEPEGWSSEMVPSVILEKLTEAECTFSPRANESVLSNYDYTGQSYFMVCVDNVAPNVGTDGVVYSETATNDTYENGSVIRLQFGIYNWGSDLNISYSEPLIAFPNKDELIKDVADYSGNKQNEAYSDAVAVLEDWDATEEEVVAAQEDLQTALDKEKASLSNGYVAKHAVAIAYVKQNAEQPAFGDEWSILSIARSGIEDVKWYQAYLASVEEEVKEAGTNILSGSRSTENSRLIIGLSAIGADPTDVAGYDLVAPLADYEYLEKQGLNGLVYALIALDCNNYEISMVEEGKIQTTRDLLVEGILDCSLENGGWAYSGTAADPDMTGMALQALAPYYSENDSVKEAVDKALTALSEIQDEDGRFASWGVTNSMSCAQVICALTALGIDLEEDVRFVKNGKSVLDGMISFFDESTGGYRYSMTEATANAAATGQVAYALTAYSRWANDKNSLYDMTDAIALTVCKHEKTEKKNVKEATCTEEGYTGDVFCTICDEQVESGKKISMKSHTIVEDPAVAPTETTSGKTEGSHCSVCKKVIVAQTVIPATGKKEEPTTEEKVTIKKPSKTQFKKVVSKKKKQLTLTWKKKSGITGYEIQVSTSSKFKSKVTTKYKVKKASTTSKTIKKLKSKKKYYVRIRTYVTKKVDGEKITKYSSWVKKSVRIK